MGYIAQHLSWVFWLRRRKYWFFCPQSTCPVQGESQLQKKKNDSIKKKKRWNDWLGWMNSTLLSTERFHQVWWKTGGGRRGKTVGGEIMAAWLFLYWFIYIHIYIYMLCFFFFSFNYLVLQLLVLSVFSIKTSRFFSRSQRWRGGKL